MKLRFILPALLLAGIAACSKELATAPQDQLLADQAIVDAPTARAALAGAYAGLQALGYYGRNLEIIGDLPADNAIWSGTFQYLGDIGRDSIKADNTTVTSVWTAIYAVIARANMVLAKVPNIPDLSTAEKNEILGEAYFLRALSYHNLVKFWGAVPMPLEPILVASEASKYHRVPVAQVYTQILSDLDKAGQLITNTSNTRQATVMAVHAIRARVFLYQANYQGALDEANIVLAGRDTLTVAYKDLFTPTGTNTSEDIFRVAFTPVQYNEMGYYYLGAGRRELQPSTKLNTAYEAGDLRKPWTIQPRGSKNLQGTKFPTTIGAEHLHVIRLAEVVLIKAEALARLNQLAAAVAEYNKVRVRAGLAPHTLDVEVTTQSDVINAIAKERRLELALEGDRWPDLVRLGTATTVLGITQNQTLFPIPANDVNTAGLTQNPGY
ncbi:MAG TPA: RagB/SusD family nutrient uptake outer membrane protein [Gemmatimonadaceae bacterium]|nr:RagB/SusD family nutrient uptake outer membrane protein [Gemmatimonadaceae bacterium]